MRRRKFIGLAGGLAAWPLVARAQQPVPVIGFLGSSSPDAYANRLRAFRQALSEAGFVEGRSLTIEYRWAQNQYDRLPELAAELVRRSVAVIVAGGGVASGLAAKAATSTIPIVFATAADPVQAGLVPSLNRPGGNVTGVANQNSEIGPKRLELIREVLPKATRAAVLVNPTNPTMVEQFRRVLEPTARVLGLELTIVQASTERELDAVFPSLAQIRAEALVIDPDVFFNGQSRQIAGRALQQALPTIYQYRLFVEAGGLISYSSSESEYYRLVGIQVGRVLKGAKPADLPVEQSTKIELLVNLKTAKALGLTMPQSIIARADEVIE